MPTEEWTSVIVLAIHVTLKLDPNVGNSLPNAHNTKIIQSLIDIAKNTDQSSKIVNSPSIDHDNQ
jgi:hypothetical protein